MWCTQELPDLTVNFFFAQYAPNNPLPLKK